MGRMKKFRNVADLKLSTVGGRGLWFLWGVWTLWFLLDPALNLGYAGADWTYSLGTAGWFFGLIVLTLLTILFRQYGCAACLLSALSIFLLLWGLSEAMSEVIFPNPYHLATLWQKDCPEMYLHFLTWLQGWMVCLVAILLGSKVFSKKYPKSNE